MLADPEENEKGNLVTSELEIIKIDHWKALNGKRKER